MLASIISFLESWAPPGLQEEYDNSGWIVHTHDSCSKALITLDCTEAVVDEAIAAGADLIIAHHPIVFKGVKRFTQQHYVNRVLIKAIQHKINIYAIHTNLDNVLTGVNQRIGEKLGVFNPRILLPKQNTLRKLVVFTPQSHVEPVLDALFSAGAGSIGAYSECSFRTTGTGSFKASENAQPFVGQIGQRHHEPEERIEVVYAFYKERAILKALRDHHPYETIAYDCISLHNSQPEIGSGMIGELPEPEQLTNFLTRVKSVFGCGAVKYTKSDRTHVKTVAWCGGSGYFLWSAARNAGADIYLTADIKYHEFFEAGNAFILADIGHYESEQFTKDLIYEQIQKKFPNFAVLISKENTNPVNYL